MQLSLYQQAALVANFIYVFTQSYFFKNVTLISQEKNILCGFENHVLKVKTLSHRKIQIDTSIFFFFF